MINIDKVTNHDIRNIINEIKEWSIKTNFNKDLINELYKELRDRWEKEQNNTRKYLKFWAIWVILLFLVVSIIMVSIRDVEAEETIICQSNKCEARLERLKECDTYTNNNEEKILCATYITLHKIERDVTPKEKEVIKEEIRNLEKLTDKKWDYINHNWFALDDIRQSYIDKFYNEALEQWLNKEEAIDMIATFLWENWKMDYKLRSYQIGANGYYDYGLCQINKWYHPKIVNNKDFFTNVDFQIANCVHLYKGGTVFYGAKHKEKMKKYLTFNN